MTGGVGCVQARLAVLTTALCGGWAASSAPTAGMAVSWLPGTLLAGFIPAEVWRNSRQVKLYLGGTVTKVVWRTCSDTRPLAPGRPRAKRLRRRTACTALRSPARHCPSNLDAGSTVLHFAPSNSGTDVPLMHAQSAQPPDGLVPRRSLRGAACPTPPRPGVRRTNPRTLTRELP